MCYNPAGNVTAGSPQDKSSWFDDKSKIFRINVKGRAQEQEKQLTMVIERRMPDPAKKIKSAYRVLYWKMI